LVGAFLFFGRGGLWAGHALGGLGEYPFLRVRQLAVSPLRRGTFSRRRKSTQKGLLLRSALAGSGSFAAGSIRAQRLRFASLHLLPLCLAAPDGRYAPTPGSIPPLSLPTSPVGQDQEHSSLRSLCRSCRRLRSFAFAFLWERACSRKRPDSRPDSWIYTVPWRLEHVGRLGCCGRRVNKRQRNCAR
jgi:hypothetical protein